MNENLFQSFYRLYKKKGFYYTLEFVKANPEYSKFFTRAIAVERASIAI